MNSHDSDERLMARLARGQDQALAQLMNRWEGPVWCFIDRMCTPAPITDDVYQEVWMRVYLYRKRYKPAMPFRPYLFAIAANCCRRALKRQWKYAVASLQEVRLPAVSDPPPIERLLADEQHGQLHLAIARLPQAQRSVVLLYLLFESDYGRIAQVLGRSPGTVRSHMHHAVAAMRSSLTRAAVAEEAEVDHERRTHGQA